MCDPKEKNLILGHTQRLKNVLHVVSYAKNAPQRPKNNEKSLGDMRAKCLLCRKATIFR